MKRIDIHRAALALLLCVLALCLTACHGSRGRADFTVPQAFDTSRQFEITFWAKNDTNKTQTEIYKKAIADFQALYPNITVSMKLYTDYGRIYNDVITNISTDTTPNVCITYPDHIATYLTGSNVVVPLDGLMDDANYGLGGGELPFDGPTRDEVIGMLYLVTLYLSSWEERDPRTGLLERRAWANAGQNKIDALCRADFLEGTNRSKPLTVTIEGCCRAEILLEEMGLGFLLDEDGLGVTNAPTSGRPKLSFVPES
jgi:hypothetical protein